VAISRKSRKGSRVPKRRLGSGAAGPETPSPAQPAIFPASDGQRGSLIVIGGREDKRGEMHILRAIAERIDGGPLVVATVGTSRAAEAWREYRALFHKIGVGSVAHLHVDVRDDAFSPEKLEVLEGARGIFFTGGDQLQITSRVGGAPICERIRDLLARGGTVAGTSAGASAMSETMLVAAPSDESPRMDAVQMAPGLGLIAGVIIDQHFAERGRLGRLVGAVAKNPRLLGIGLDEDTAVIAEGTMLRVMGSGAVYVVDGVRESYTNVSEEKPDSVTSVFDLKLHILSAGDSYDLERRRPARGRSKK
jgi:cyanophycinase